MSEKHRDQVQEALGTVIDPELGIDIVSLGLIYGVAIDEDNVGVLMTLTTPGCPMHGTIRNDVEEKLRRLPWIREVSVQVTYSPEWTPERLTPKARAMLGR
ncbi:MAG TPA: metal-sulfur cluster assembly factor [Candidatus Baltobacteraceae bacterium]|nr:metal-sulfur cluster assembly factor [Candidatus Baltobacteraceae bacterium]